MLVKINYTFLAAFAAGLLATSGDITMTWTSPIYPKLYSNDTSINPLGKPITQEEDGWIGSLINIGAMIGPFIFSFIAEKFGRRIGLLCIAIPHITAYITFAFARNVYLFYFGRLFGGISVGGGYTLLPMYMAEISEDSNRGFLSVSLIFFWSMGNLLPYAIGPFVSIMVLNLILACIPISFFIVFLLFGVETPYYWLKLNKPRKAQESLMTLRSLDKKGVQKELEHIQKNFKREEGGHFSDIIKNRGLRKALIISLLLIIFQQLSGVNAVGFYLQSIFEASGTDIPSDISSLIYGFAILITCFIPIGLVSRFGRRTLHMVSCVGVSLSIVLIGIFFYLHDSTDIDINRISWLPIFSLLMYVFTFSIGVAVIPWTLSSELFPVNVKQISASAVSTTCWITSFIVTKFFNDMNTLMGRAGTFWFFTGCTVVACVFTIFFVPETKGKSFREIQDLLLT
ncbi:hypothetical protein NQ318_002661 [Aromia moschata]|uniref:Major facilitator superfamily (MFS) profile domain-containing protein n=1 Tax=Aromia moschata TaxID=1265417 RepID=A0AAV8XXG4_9CUCU|nr:hypothetical protein NQ318_002661 [Aromia moschata]